MTQIPEIAKKLSLEFIDFVNLAVSPFHVIQQSVKKLNGYGFQELKETENWNLQPGGKYFFTRNLTTLIAFVVGQKFDPNNTGFKVIGGHTDSPCLRLAPVSKLTSVGINQACISTYGGGLWHTWFDRDLTVAGRVLYRKDQSYKETLFYHPKPILKIPNLAIHLNTDRAKFEPNTESHLRPVFSTQVYETLTGVIENKQLPQKHYSQLYDLIQKETGINPQDIIDLDFVLADTQPAQLIGIHEEFISSPRLDNLISSFSALTAITQSNDNSSWINMACLFDHEEVGSSSSQGADSALMNQTLERVYRVLANGKEKIDSFQMTINRSFIISADMAHGIHPNYQEKHQCNHKVKINEGVVFKYNPNQRYSTDGSSSALVRAIADIAQIPIQDFIVRNDSPCGSTIGPILSSQTGIKTIDIGIPQWGMHSIRETCGTVDLYYYIKLFDEFYRSFDKLNHNLLGQ